jgi:hypothetical protein
MREFTKRFSTTKSNLRAKLTIQTIGAAKALA